MKNQSSSAQRKRILNRLRNVGSGGMTTIQAREDLDVMAPAPRIFELRNLGHEIVTIRDCDENAQGNNHPCARYVLVAEIDAGGDV